MTATGESNAKAKAVVIILWNAVRFILLYIIDKKSKAAHVVGSNVSFLIRFDSDNFAFCTRITVLKTKIEIGHALFQESVQWEEPAPIFYIDISGKPWKHNFSSCSAIVSNLYRIPILYFIHN